MNSIRLIIYILPPEYDTTIYTDTKHYKINMYSLLC
jgi:hypothetical protein